MSHAHEFVGLKAYSRDGERIGRVDGVTLHPDSENVECLVVTYGSFRDLVVPVEAVQKKHDGVVVPISQSFLDASPDGGAGPSSSRQRRHP
jgi:sporulation protein YlmC with PRC-barrel domain